jgi:hypothetical protein
MARKKIAGKGDKPQSAQKGGARSAGKSPKKSVPLKAQSRNIDIQAQAVANRLKSAQARTVQRKRVSQEQTQPVMQEEVKFVLTETREPTVAPQEYKLPLRYYDDRMVLLARDPWWMFTYWDISNERIDSIVSSIPHSERSGIHRVIRVYDVTGIGNFTGSNYHSFFDIDVSDQATNWYLNVNQPERSFCTEIGLRTPVGNFYALARSNVCAAPYYGISEQVDEEWMSLSDEEYARILGLGSFDMTAQGGGINTLSSAQFVEEMRRRLEEMVSSGGASEQLQMGGASEMLSSGAFGRARARKFFLEVGTDVIVYGRTEPDAQLMFCGKQIQLNPDGTFRFRFALPVGDYDYPVQATSADGIDTITIVPQVQRKTKDNKPERIYTEGFEKKSV